MRDSNGVIGPTVLELFAGAGGMSIGLERAGFVDVGKIDNDHTAVQTLRMNRPRWNVVEADVRDVSGADYQGVDLVAASLPTPPLSVVGIDTGQPEPPDLSGDVLRIVREAAPRAVLIEGINGLGRDAYGRYRSSIENGLDELDYVTSWRVIEASDHGVAQLRRAFVLVAVRRSEQRRFVWPGPARTCPTVGAALRDLMGAQGWPGLEAWTHLAGGIAPKIIGSSHAFGTLVGMTGPRLSWRNLGIDPLGIAGSAPSRNDPTDLTPRLTNRMVARLQGVDDDWRVSGTRGEIYRQLASVSVPAIAEAVGTSLSIALGARMAHPSSQPALPVQDEPTAAPGYRPRRRQRSASAPAVTSTTTGAWSDGPVPLRALRST